VSNGSSKSQLETVAQCKFDDSLLLFEHGRFSNSFYLAGYAIECALKACIARQLLPETIPDKSFVNAFYTHKFDALIGLAGLRNELRVRQDADQTFQANWGLASEWSPDVRYEPVDRSMANLMVIAVGDERHGVLPWIKTYW
jgi:hypothetical protein